MPKTYPIKFGYMELKAIRYALGNSMEFDDVVQSLFPEKNEKMAAERGYRKIKRAVILAQKAEGRYPSFEEIKKW